MSLVGWRCAAQVRGLCRVNVQRGQCCFVDFRVFGTMEHEADPLHVLYLRDGLRDDAEGDTCGILHRVTEGTGGDVGEGNRIYLVLVWKLLSCSRTEPRGAGLSRIGTSSPLILANHTFQVNV